MAATTSFAASLNKGEFLIVTLRTRISINWLYFVHSLPHV